MERIDQNAAARIQEDTGQGMPDGHVVQPAEATTIPEITAERPALSGLTNYARSKFPRSYDEQLEALRERQRNSPY